MSASKRSPLFGNVAQLYRKPDGTLAWDITPGQPDSANPYVKKARARKAKRPAKSRPRTAR
jgi:hypothetical protein